MNLGEQIRMARHARDWTQMELGEKVGVCAATIHSWERGKRKPTSTHLRKLKEILDINPAKETEGKMRKRSATENALYAIAVILTALWFAFLGGMVARIYYQDQARNGEMKIGNQVYHVAPIYRELHEDADDGR